MIGLLKSKLASKEEEVLSLTKGIVTYINPFAYLKLRKHPALNAFDIITSDGIVLKILSSLFLGKKVERISPDFSSYFTPLFEEANRKETPLYILGTEQSLLEKAIANFKVKYPELNIIGSRNGYFNSDNEIDTCIDEILTLNPAKLIIGMGTPQQEDFLIKLKNKGFEGVGYACGGFLHQSSSSTSYYPNWANKLHLRWFYRILREPKLIKRYTIDYGWFVIVFFWDLFFGKR